MKCPLCNETVTESELDSNVRGTMTAFSGETKAKPHYIWVCPKCDKILAITSETP
jgi:hypothetical protein